jgi:acetoin utilization protein AcuB
MKVSKEQTMAKAILKDYMTPAPHTINATQNLKFAQERMKEFNVRHLPVLEAGNLVGILSERDIQFVESFDSLKPEEITVEDAYTDELYQEEQTAVLSEVCASMAEKKVGSVLVMDGGKLAGIFTWIDALKYIAKNG